MSNRREPLSTATCSLTDVFFYVILYLWNGVPWCIFVVDDCMLPRFLAYIQHFTRNVKGMYTFYFERVWTCLAVLFHCAIVENFVFSDLKCFVP